MDIKQQLNDVEVLQGLCVQSVHGVDDFIGDCTHYLVSASKSYGEPGKVYMFVDHGAGLVYVGVSGEDLIDEPYWNRVV